MTTTTTRAPRARRLLGLAITGVLIGTLFTVVSPTAPAADAAAIPIDPLYTSCADTGSDEFDGSSLDTGLWRVIDSANAEHTVSGGALRMPTYQVNSGDVPFVQQPLPSGAWEATTEVTLNPTANYQQAGLNIWVSSTEYVKLDSYWSGGKRKLQFTWTGRSNISGTDQIDAPSGIGATVWFRVASDGTQLTGEYSIDGKTFIAIGRAVPLSSFSPTHIGLSALRGATSTGAELTAEFAWFRWSPDAGAAGGCPDPLYRICPGADSDEFPGTSLHSRWRVLNSGSASHSVSGGALVMPTYKVNSGDVPWVQQELPGSSWEATTEVDISPAGSYQQAGLNLWQSSSSYAKLGTYYSSGEQRLQFIWTGRSSVFGTDQIPVPSGTGSTIWLRMTSDGSEVTASYSIDGDTFTGLGRAVPLTTFAPTHLGLEALRGATSTAPAIDARFAWFRWTPTPAELTACGYLTTGGGGGVTEFEAARLTWRDYLTGGDAYSPTAEPYASALARLDSDVDDFHSGLNLAASGEIWSDLDTSMPIPRLEAFRRIKAMALAWATHGSDHEGDPVLLADTIEALDWLSDTRYNAGSTYVSGDWWYWEIGYPLELNDTTVLLYDELSAGQIDQYMDAIEQFRPTVNRTGANRVWAAMVVGLRGVIVESSTKVAAARDGLSQVFDYTTTGDGFYRDGSFIQHNYYAYTGGYGTSLVLNLSELLFLLDGTPWQVTDTDLGNVYDWVEDSFDPVMYDAAMMDAMRGREMSRYYNEDRDAGATTLRGILLLAESAGGSDRTLLREIALRHLEGDSLDTYVEAGTITELSLGEAVLADAGLDPAPALRGFYAFNSMDRAVHHGEGFAFTVAMSSTRQATFEVISGQNYRSWYTADGMTYLYGDDLTQYSDGYWPTVNRYRLPGTTVDTIVKSNTAGNGQRPAVTMVGSAASASGDSGATGMLLDAYGSTLAARKAWFFFDDEVVALGNGITATGQTGTGWDGQTRGVETTVDTRKLPSGTTTLRVDGTTRAATTGTTQTVTDAGWAHLDAPSGDVGYVFPDGQTISVLRESRTGGWADINPTQSPAGTLSRTFMTLWIEHGTNPSAQTYEYVVLPGATSSATSAYSASPDVEVLANSATVSAVHETGLDTVGAVFWTDAVTVLSIAGQPFLEVDKRAVVTTEEDVTGIDLTIVDPTQAQTGVITVELMRSASSTVSTSPGVTVVQLSPTIILSVDVDGAKGAPFEARFAY